MTLYILADVDYEQFDIIGVFTSIELAKAAVDGRTPDGNAFWIAERECDTPYFRAYLTSSSERVVLRRHREGGWHG